MASYAEKVLAQVKANNPGEPEFHQAVTEVLESLMERHPQTTYLIMLGFMFGSLPELFPGVPSGMDLVYSVIAALLGFAALYWMSGRE